MKDVSAAAVSRRKTSPPKLAKRWGVACEKVIGFIRSGELAAINIATRLEGRPRYLIDEAAIEQFERARSVTPPPKPAPRTRRKSSALIKEFF